MQSWCGFVTEGGGGSKSLKSTLLVDFRLDFDFHFVAQIHKESVLCEHTLTGECMCHVYLHGVYNKLFSL